MKPLIIGHRGVCSEPENTLKAFKKAIELKVDMVELDVRLTKDKIPVVMHDENVNRTTNGRGRVNELTLKEVKRLDAGDGEQVPTLQEVIDLVKGKAKLVIEIKTYATIKPVARLIKKNQIINSTIVISFGHIISKMFKKMIPGVLTGVLLVSLPINPIKTAEDANADFLISYYETILAGSPIYKRVLKQAKKKNIKVLAAEIHEKDSIAQSQIKQLMKMGVDGFVLNRPNLALNIDNKKRFMFW